MRWVAVPVRILGRPFDRRQCTIRITVQTVRRMNSDTEDNGQPISATSDNHPRTSHTDHRILETQRYRNTLHSTNPPTDTHSLAIEFPLFSSTDLLSLELEADIPSCLSCSFARRITDLRNHLATRVRPSLLSLHVSPQIRFLRLFTAPLPVHLPFPRMQ